MKVGSFVSGGGVFVCRVVGALSVCVCVFMRGLNTAFVMVPLFPSSAHPLCGCFVNWGQAETGSCRTGSFAPQD